MAISPSPFDRIQKNRRVSARLWLWWVVLIALLVVGAIFFRQQAAQALWYVTAPVVRLRDAFGGGQVAQLRAQLASTTALLADRNALYKENIDLKARLGRTGTQPRILAAILQGPPWVPYDTLLVDAGAREGVVQDDLVAASGQALIGRVAEVYEHQSRIELFSAPGQSYQATLDGTLPIAVEGQGGGSMLAQVPAGTNVAVGDPVLLPGIAGGITADVSAVDAKAGESFIAIYMRLPVAVADLRFVEIIKP